MDDLYIGNIVSFIDTLYFIDLIIIKEDAILYKYNKGYIDVTEHLENLEEYVDYIINNENSMIISNLPVHDKFIDEDSLKPYIKKIKKLTR